MLKKLFHDKFAVALFVFNSALLSGLVFVGICSSFSFMLSEKGVGIKTITHLLMATIPYSWKFAISPFIKNFLIKFEKSKFNVIKTVALLSQLTTFFGFASLGFFEHSQTLAMSSFVILLTIFSVSVHDIVRGHIKLVLFDSTNMGLVSAVENAGFRVGMFLAGACLIYLANALNWKLAFLISSTCVFLSTFSVIFAKMHVKQHYATKNESTNFKEYFAFCLKILKRYAVFILLIVIFSFKFTDSCINVLKPAFMLYLGISKLEFANIAHVAGLFTTIISGIVAGITACKFGTPKCIKLTFIMQILTSIAFLYLASFKTNLVTITVLVNIATFTFGFSNVIFRTFTAEESKKDINTYTILLSIGSIVRISSYSVAGWIVEHYSWYMIYFLCVVSNIPGIFLYSKLRSKKYKTL
ncbi:MAG: MFS transporter [Holosporales bacterium]|jgi:PAT family beta-lactamase induction signal transducer AmpG|nr:MFS transporter [Holosporales bacterium]